MFTLVKILLADASLPEWAPQLPTKPTWSPEEEAGFISDILGGIWDGVVSIADLVTSAFRGAVEILDYIADFLPSFRFLSDLFPSPVETIVVSILSVMVTVITFKVVGYFT